MPSSPLVTRRSAPPAEPKAMPRRITRLQPLPTTITLDDGTVLEIHLTVSGVRKRLNEFDRNGRPAYDVELTVHTYNVTAEDAKNGSPFAANSFAVRREPYRRPRNSTDRASRRTHAIVRA
jgi:hypothetical protein